MRFIQTLLVVPVAALLFTSCNGKGSAGKIETQTDSISYIIGAIDGERLVSDFERSDLDSLINMKKLFKAFETAALEKDLKMDPDSNTEFLNGFNMAYREYMMAKQSDTSGNVVFDKSDAYMDSVSYLIGASYGKSIVMGFAENKLDSIIDMNLFVSGVQDAGNGEELVLETEENMPMVQAYFENLQEERLEAEFGEVKKAGEEYLATNGALSNVITTASGLQYEVITEGKGEVPSLSDKVKVHYHGTLIDGTVFDSSVDRGEPATFGVGQVIPGWVEALQLMTVGSKWKITVPSELAYGKNPHPQSPIKPYSVLIFDVELIEIVK